MVVLQLAVGQRPHLDHAVPPTRHNDRVGHRRREAHARHPVGVAVLGDCVLALAERVPQLDRAVAGARDDLAVVGREGHREDVFGVPVERVAHRLPRLEVPQPQRVVPRARESKLTVRRDHDVRHKVRVALEGARRHAVVVLLPEQIPHNDRLVARRRQDPVRDLWGGGDLGDPPAVAHKGAAQFHVFSGRHFADRDVRL
mmetsp:Transcript_23811/g.62322  ORF Transcript_23811/g.62322 Transcript_23811/m.62322 type:complete len:200 (+) Transcript_23811:724-1323(+)